MADERTELTGSELARWAFIFVLVLAGLGVALWLVPDTEPIAPPLAEVDS